MLVSSCSYQGKYGQVIYENRKSIVSGSLIAKILKKLEPQIKDSKRVIVFLTGEDHGLVGGYKDFHCLVYDFDAKKVFGVINKNTGKFDLEIVDADKKSKFLLNYYLSDGIKFLKSLEVDGLSWGFSNQTNFYDIDRIEGKIEAGSIKNTFFDETGKPLSGPEVFRN